MEQKFKKISYFKSSDWRLVVEKSVPGLDLPRNDRHVSVRQATERCEALKAKLEARVARL